MDITVVQYSAVLEDFVAMDSWCACDSNSNVLKQR